MGKGCRVLRSGHAGNTIVTTYPIQSWCTIFEHSVARFVRGGGGGRSGIAEANRRAELAKGAEALKARLAPPRSKPTLRKLHA